MDFVAKLPVPILAFALTAGLTTAGFCLSTRVRYYVRLTVYFTTLHVVALIALPIAIVNYGQPNNFRIAAGMFYYLRFLFGVRWHLHGRENIKRKPYVIVSNHQSAIDVIGMLVHWDTFHPVVPVIKAELRYALTFGLFCNLSGAVFVDRGTEKGRQALHNALALLKRDRTSIWIFPEGTRNYGKTPLLPFKKGAFHMAIQTQFPILPVVFSDYSPFYNSPMQRFDSGSASLTILPEIPVKGLTSEHVSELCDHTYAIMLKALTPESHGGNEKSYSDSPVSTSGSSEESSMSWASPTPISH